MDRGFSSLCRIQKLNEKNQGYFLLRIKNNIRLEMLDNGKFLVGTGAQQVVSRVVNFCDLESPTEFRFVTNLPETGAEGISNELFREFYRYGAQIEFFWKFLKMHLQLDRIITKNTNEIVIQIYTCLIAYVLLQLVTIPQELGDKLLDKLRYLQAFMSDQISYVHWLPQERFLLTE